MPKKKKKIKLYVFITVLIFFFLLFLYLIIHPFNYTKTYNVSKYKIEESYDKEKGYYTFLISDKGITYSYLINHKYSKARELINNIEEYKSDNEVCIIPSGKLDFFPLCSNEEGEVYAYNLSNVSIDTFKNRKIKSLDKTYQKIDLNYLNNKNYALFNYRGFAYLNEDTFDNINIFNKDIYNLELEYMMGEYLIVPNYNEEFFFTSFYVINLKTGKYEEIKLDTKVSFNSTFLGDYKNKVYLLDKKEEKEYRLDLRKKKLEEVDYLILENNKLISKDYKEIVNKKLNFLSIDFPTYEVKDNTLYKVINKNYIKLSDKVITKIIKVEDDTVYYLSENNLMMHNGEEEILLMQNFEWNFNNTNMIFIY